jgi:hypothetical protein
VIRIHEEFMTPHAADEFLNDQLRQFPPATYGTTLRLFRERLTGEWVVAGSRFVS